MITTANFLKIQKEVIDSLNEAFDFLKLHCISHDYILFLADGEYKSEYKNSPLKINPHAIDNREDSYKDESRLSFFVQFMNDFYSFPTTSSQTTDNEYRLTVELMVYTHIWESKPFLKQLYRLASLVDGKSYPWKITVPDMSKHTYIRSDIRDTMRNKKLKLASVISKGFHTSLRNAFAHSEYRIDVDKKLIHLDTYKGEAWDIKNISFDDWTKRFIYSSLLSYHFLEIKSERRLSLPDVFGKSEFIIAHPISHNIFRMRKIYYNKEFDTFSFYKR